MKYRISNIYTGYVLGLWDSYDKADCYRTMLDDWMDWIVEEF